MSTNLQAGIIGAGAIATHGHIPGYLAADGVEIVALCDVNAERAVEVARKEGIPRTYAHYEEMLDKESLDLVSVCSPNAFHEPMAIAAMKAGAHVICEKPMALTHEEALQMVETSRACRRSLTVGHHMRYQPATVKAREVIDSGALGDIYYAKASYLRRNGIPGYGSWFTNKDLAGGGALMDIGCHMLDLVLWLMGNPEPVQVVASTYAEFGPLAKGLGTWGVDHYGAGTRFDVDDLATALVRLANGATLLLEASWATHGSQGQRFQLFGTQGGLELNAAAYGVDTPLCLFGEEDGQLTEELLHLPDIGARGHQALIPAWIEALRAGAEPLIRPEQAATVVQIIEAAYQSAASGSAIDL